MIIGISIMTIFIIAIVMLYVNRNLPCIIEDQSCNVFEGSLGDESVRMMICRNGKDITAYYVTEQNEEEHVLTGSYNNITKKFKLADKNGFVMMQGKTYKDTQNDLIVLVDYGEKEDFYLVPTHILRGYDRQNLYAFWGYNTQKVEEFTDYVVDLINKNKCQELSQLIAYPLTVYTNGDTIVINDSQEFLNNYDEIITNDYRDAIVQEFRRYLFANYMGIYFGIQNDFKNFWFYPDGEFFKINSISNMDENRELPQDYNSYGIEKG